MLNLVVIYAGFHVIVTALIIHNTFLFLQIVQVLLLQEEVHLVIKLQDQVKDSQWDQVIILLLLQAEMEMLLLILEIIVLPLLLVMEVALLPLIMVAHQLVLMVMLKLVQLEMAQLLVMVMEMHKLVLD